MESKNLHSPRPAAALRLASSRICAPSILQEDKCRAAARVHSSSPITTKRVCARRKSKRSLCPAASSKPALLGQSCTICRYCGARRIPWIPGSEKAATRSHQVIVIVEEIDRSGPKVSREQEHTIDINAEWLLRLRPEMLRVSRRRRRPLPTLPRSLGAQPGAVPCRDSRSSTRDLGADAVIVSAREAPAAPLEVGQNAIPPLARSPPRRSLKPS